MSNLIQNIHRRRNVAAARPTNTVGWFLTDKDASVIYDPPTRVKSAPVENVHAKSAARCPATIAVESRSFEVKCPVDINIIITKDKDGKLAFKNLNSDSSTIRNNKLGNMIKIVSEKEWRYKDKPMIQLVTPYMFISDEPIYVTQTGAHLHYYRDPLPGTTFSGRYPIDVWPRQLMWAFEWHEPKKPLKIARGTPLFYVNFETQNPDRPIRMVEAEKTEELNAYLKAIGGAVGYVNQTFSLFNRAREIRPKKLLVPKK